MQTNQFDLATRDVLLKKFKSDFVLKESHLIFKETLNNRKFVLSKGRHSSKNIIMWERYGLIEDNRIDNIGRKKYSFTESLWVDLIKQLKRFGLHSKTIIPIKEMLCETEDKAGISTFPLLDFYISFVLRNEQVFLLTDDNASSFLITKEHLDAAENQPNYKHEHMVKINLNNLVNKLLEELPMELSNNLHLSLNN